MKRKDLSVSRFWHSDKTISLTKGDRRGRAGARAHTGDSGDFRRQLRRAAARRAQKRGGRRGEYAAGRKTREMAAGLRPAPLQYLLHNHLRRGADRRRRGPHSPVRTGLHAPSDSRDVGNLRRGPRRGRADIPGRERIPAEPGFLRKRRIKRRPNAGRFFHIYGSFGLTGRIFAAILSTRMSICAKLGSPPRPEEPGFTTVMPET